ncbi:MAG: hypothetical protein HKM24_07610 [Gammaproteobacteria bacterium]|nr:hypothetical protein [Gammaproteobacteria bacterium]
MNFGNPKSVENYIATLVDGEQSLVGAWQQGSTVLGYDDQWSDKDIILVWDQFPDLKERETAATKSGLNEVEFTEKSYKGLDTVYFDDKTFGFGHISTDSFFSVYQNLFCNEIEDRSLYRLGGLSRGEILFDPANRLSSYKKEIVVTDALVDRYKQQTRNLIESKQSWAETSKNRQQPIEFLQSLHRILCVTHILQYLENKMWPMSMKWIQKDAERFGWNSNYIRSVKLLKQTLPFDELSSLFC